MTLFIDCKQNAGDGGCPYVLNPREGEHKESPCPVPCLDERIHCCVRCTDEDRRFRRKETQRWYYLTK